MTLAPAARDAERLGLFGGTFDPVHAGHLHVARVARSARELDHVVFVPAGRPPHKPGRQLASAVHRCAMLALALDAELTPAERVATSIWEIELEGDGPSYTVDTLRELIAQRPSRPRPYLILGSDNLSALDSWRSVDELLALVEPIVVYRAGFGLDLLAQLTLEPDSRAALERGFSAPPPDPTSSTAIRAGGPGERERVPAPVADYIQRHGLYSSGS